MNIDRCLLYKENGTATQSFVAEALSKEGSEGEIDQETEYCIKSSAGSLYTGNYAQYYQIINVLILLPLLKGGSDTASF
jgi:hypothetical protein